jgi:hypothetical protein
MRTPNLGRVERVVALATGVVLLLKAVRELVAPILGW